MGTSICECGKVVHGEERYCPTCGRPLAVVVNDMNRKSMEELFKNNNKHSKDVLTKSRNENSVKKRK